MKNYVELLKGHFEGTGLSGFVTCFSQWDEKKQLNYIVSCFKRYAKKQAKYLAEKHDMDLVECQCFIVSGLYSIFTKRQKFLLKKYGNFSSLNYFAMKKVFSSLRISYAKVNFLEGGFYHNDAINLPEVNATFKDKEGDSYTLKIHGAIKHGATLEKTINKATSTQSMDLVDILQREINRDSRREQKVINAVYALNIEGDTTIQDNSFDYMTKDEQKKVREKMKAMAEDEKNNVIKAQELTKLHGYYLTPEEYVLNKYRTGDNGAAAYIIPLRLKAILMSREALNKSELEYLRRWKIQNGCKIARIEDLREYFLI